MVTFFGSERGGASPRRQTWSRSCGESRDLASQGATWSVELSQRQLPRASITLLSHLHFGPRSCVIRVKTGEAVPLILSCSSIWSQDRLYYLCIIQNLDISRTSHPVQASKSDLSRPPGGYTLMLTTQKHFMAIAARHR